MHLLYSFSEDSWVQWIHLPIKYRLALTEWLLSSMHWPSHWWQRDGQDCPQGIYTFVRRQTGIRYCKHCEKGQLTTYSLRNFFRGCRSYKEKYHVYFLERQRYKTMPNTVFLFLFVFLTLPKELKRNEYLSLRVLFLFLKNVSAWPRNWSTSIAEFLAAWLVMPQNSYNQNLLSIF